MDEKLYFAYGSNIDLNQMRHRCPDARVMDKVILPDYELLFRGYAGSGLATIKPKKGGTVHGLLWKITSLCERSLDQYEGFPRLYDKQNVEVRDSQGRSVPVMVYVMVEGQYLRPATPSHFYYQGIRDGYRQNGLPEEALGEALEQARREVQEWERERTAPPEPHEKTEEVPTKLYFAYGSNINLEQMEYRCPDAEAVCNVILDNYSLVFRGRNDGNGVATIVPDKGRKVYGKLWKLTPKCERSLDRWEGCPFVYDKQLLTVRDMDGKHYTAMTYTMTRAITREPAMPSEVYYQRIRDGYQQNALPTKALNLALRRIRDEVAERKEEVIHPDKPKEETEQNGRKKKRHRER